MVVGTLIAFLLFGFLPVSYLFVFKSVGVDYPRVVIVYLLALFSIIYYLVTVIFKTSSLKVNALDLLILAYLGWFLLSTGFSKSWYASIFGLPIVYAQGGVLMMVSLLVLYYAFRYFASIKLLYLSIIFLFLSTLFSLIYGYFIKTNASFYKGIPIRVTAIENSPIYFANFILFTAPIALAVFLSAKNWYLKTASFLILVVCAGHIILSLTRSVWIVSLLAVAIFLFVYLKATKPNIARVFLYPSVILFIAFVVGTFIYFYPLISDRLEDLVQNRTIYSSIRLRLLEYNSSLKIIQHNPIFGVGPDAIYYAFLVYKSTEINQNEKEWLALNTQIRNFYLQQAATVGVVGLIIFLGIIGYIVSLFWHFFATQRATSANSILFGMFVSWLSLVIHFFLYAATTIPQVFFWASGGILVGLMRDHPKNKYLFEVGLPSNRIVLNLLFFVASGLAIFSCYLIYRDYLSRKYFRDFSQSKDHQKAISSLEQSMMSNPYNPVYKLAYVSSGLDEISSYLSADDQKGVGKVSVNESIAKLQTYLDQVRKIDPNDPSLYRYQATLSYIKFSEAKYTNPAERKQEFERAERDALLANKLDPTNPLVLDILTSVYLEDDGLKLAEAEDTARDTIRLKYTYAHAHHHLGEVLKQQGRFKEAIDAYMEVFKFSPNDEISKDQITKIQTLLGS